MRISFSRRAIKTMSRLDEMTMKRIRAAVTKLPNGDVKKLVGTHNAYRLRVGGYRVLFDMDSQNIGITDVLPRGDAYK